MNALGGGDMPLYETGKQFFGCWYKTNMVTHMQGLSTKQTQGLFKL